MKDIKISLAGREYHLVMNGTAMFDLNDTYGGVNAFLDKSGEVGREGFEALCHGLAVMAEQGELLRRAMGYDKGPMLSVELARAVIMPKDVAPLRQAAFAAIMAGFGREVEPEGDVDEGLLELEQKKTEI